jgi:CRISPR-associated protein Cas2
VVTGGGGGPGLRRARPWQGARPGEATNRQGASEELLTLLAFDVPSDKVRRKVGEMCKDYGLGRVQWSVFAGPMTRNRREELWGRLVKMLSAAEGGGRVLVYPIGQREASWGARWETTGVPPRDPAHPHDDPVEPPRAAAGGDGE